MPPLIVLAISAFCFGFGVYTAFALHRWLIVLAISAFCFGFGAYTAFALHRWLRAKTQGMGMEAGKATKKQDPDPDPDIGPETPRPTTARITAPRWIWLIESHKRTNKFHVLRSCPRIKNRSDIVTFELCKSCCPWVHVRNSV
jgi:hypothetical protein